MKTQEALKLALEALEELKYSSSSHAADGIYYEAITAIREALAEQPAPSSHLTDEQKAANGLAWLARLEAMREEFAGLAEQPAPVAEPHKQHDCSRSHPHENMDAMCELRTEIARLTNENARLKAKQQSDEVNAYRMTLLCIRDGLQQGMSKSIQKLQAREINDVLGLPSFASYRTSPQPSKPWVPLTDVERAEVQYEAHKKGLMPLEFMELHEAKLRKKNAQPSKPLTDEQIMDVTRKAGNELLDFIYEYGTASEGIDQRVVKIARAIEAAHGIKENT